MRLAVLSDIHGNLPALEAVVADARRHHVDAFAVAGDFTGGPWSQETVARIRDLAGWIIAGNHEHYYLSYDRGTAPAGWYGSEQWAAMRWSYHRLSGEALDYMARLPEQAVLRRDGADPVRVVHGTLQSMSAHLYPDRNPEVLAAFRRAGLLRDGRKPPPLTETIADVAEPVLICGHTHIAWVQRESHHLVANAGSVGSPINGDWRAQYAILTWADGRWQIELRAVPYEVARVRAAFEAGGYLAEGGAVARAILLGVENGLNVVGHLLRHAYKVATDQGLRGVDIVPNDVWHGAVASFDWAAYGDV